MKNIKLLATTILFFISVIVFSQSTHEIKLNPEKVKKFQAYVQHKHGGEQGFPVWKETNKMLYAQEMWYYSESFYLKRDHLKEGVILNEEIIDISRFESNRKENEEAIVTLPGFKDAIVLIPANKLIYKP